MSVDPRRGRPYRYLDAPPLANDQGVTGQEVDESSLPPARYDNADGYDVPIRIDVPLPIEEYPYDGVPQPYDKGPKMHNPGPMEDADDPEMVAIGQWQRGVYERGNEVRYTSAGVFEVDPQGRIVSTMPSGAPMV